MQTMRILHWDSLRISALELVALRHFESFFKRSFFVHGSVWRSQADTPLRFRIYISAGGNNHIGLNNAFVSPNFCTKRLWPFIGNVVIKSEPSACRRNMCVLWPCLFVIRVYQYAVVVTHQTRCLCSCWCWWRPTIVGNPFSTTSHVLPIEIDWPNRNTECICLTLSK